MVGVVAVVVAVVVVVLAGVVAAVVLVFAEVVVILVVVVLDRCLGIYSGVIKCNVGAITRLYGPGEPNSESTRPPFRVM